MNHRMPNLVSMLQEISENQPADRLTRELPARIGSNFAICRKQQTWIVRQVVNNQTCKSLVFVSMFAAVSGCVVEMHPADSAPTPSPAPAASGAPTAAAPAAQPVKVLSGPSGITGPTKATQPATAPTATSTDTSVATATQATSGGAS